MPFSRRASISTSNRLARLGADAARAAAASPGAAGSSAPGRKLAWPPAVWLLVGWLVWWPAAPRPATADPIAAASPATAEADPGTLIRALNDQLVAGQIDSALTICHRYLALYPDDPGMLYNLACLQEVSGQREQALQSLGAAISGGFDDFHQIESDRDLAALVTDPRYVALRSAREAQIATEAAAGALRLVAGEQLTGIPLRSALAVPGAEAPAAGSLDVRFEQGALALDLTLDDPSFRGGAPPWRGGSGLFVNLIIPDSSDPFASEEFFGFAFGMFQRRTTGAILVAGDAGAAAEEDRWQRVAELAPKIRIDEQNGRVHLSALIPWRAVAPYHPLIDSEWGLNVVYQSYRSDGRRWTAALIPDPAVPDAPHRWRRFVPLSLEPGSASDAQLAGRLSDTVVTDGRLDVDLVAWVPAAGTAALTIAVTDADGQSVVSGGSQSDRQRLQAGITRWRQAIDLAALATGSYTVAATLELPHGPAINWQTPVLRLSPGWLTTMQARLGAVPPAEQATVAYRLDAVERALRAHRPRQNPTPLITTVGEIELMLRQAENSGSILPVAGRFVMVYPGPHQEDRLCTLQLPAGHERGAPLLVVLPAAARTAAILARQIAQQLPPASRLTVAVPHLPPVGADAASAVAQAAAALTWLNGYFAPEATHLAGVDAGAGTALRLSLAEPGALARVLLIAGGGFAPWPEASGAQLENRLAAQRNSLRYDWIRFGAETGGGQADAVHAAMTALGFRLGWDESPEGGLSVSQASGRISRWVTGP